MTDTLEAVEGVLVALSDGTPPDRATAIENSLILAWRAAMKSGEYNTFFSVLGKIGWTESGSGVEQKSVPVVGFGTAIMNVISECNSIIDPIPDFKPILTAADGAGHSLANSWWNSGNEQANGHGICWTTDGPDTVLRCYVLLTSMPDPWRVIFDPTALASLQCWWRDFTLNSTVFDGLKDDIAQKVEPYRKDILRMS